MADDGEDSPATISDSLLDRLPNELWLRILIHFDYGQLKRLSRVCKAFKSFVEVRQPRQRPWLREGN